MIQTPPGGGRARDDVVDALRAMVHSGTVQPGQRFPAERTLAEELAVARVTLREALKELQRQGYIETRRGPHGGAFVTDLKRPVGDWVERMKSNSAELHRLFDLRQIVEMGAARFAAERRTDAQLSLLRDSVAAMRAASTLGEFRGADSRFHELVGEAAHSARLDPIIRQLRGEMFTPLDLISQDVTPDIDADQHQAVLDAITDQDPDRAAELMFEHIERTRGLFDSLLRSDA